MKPNNPPNRKNSPVIGPGAFRLLMKQSFPDIAKVVIYKEPIKIIIIPIKAKIVTALGKSD